MMVICKNTAGKYHTLQHMLTCSSPPLIYTARAESQCQSSPLTQVVILGELATVYSEQPGLMIRHLGNSDCFGKYIYI